MKRISVSQTCLDFQLEETNEMITSHSGLALIQELALASGVVKSIAEHLPGPQSNRGYQPQEFVMPLVLMFCGGGRALEEIREIGQDKGLLKLCDLERIPSSDAIGDWLRRKGNLKGIKRVNQGFARQSIDRSGLNEFTMDTDATYMETEKNCARENYEGKKSFSVLLSFLPEVDVCVRSDYRNGNISPATGVKEHLAGTIALLKSMGKRLKYFRSDSAGYNSEIFNLCTDRRNRVIFTITADQDAAVKREIKAIPERGWQRLYDRDGFYTGRHYAATVHCMEKTRDSFTLVVQRWLNPQAQAGLFDDTEPEKSERPEPYCYHVIATNDDDRAKPEIVWFHNQRCNSENYNKELKSGYGMDYAPSRQVAANAVYFEIGLLAYNLVTALKRWLLDESWWRKTIATLRWELLSIGGKVVAHARKLCLRVARRHVELMGGIRTRLRTLLTTS